LTIGAFADGGVSSNPLSGSYRGRSFQVIGDCGKIA
jgi:hypothetical protein